MNIELSRTSRITAGVLLLALVTVESGGLYVVQLVGYGAPATEFQLRFSRAGHAHAGVLLILSLVALLYADAARLTGIVARFCIPAAALLMATGFFLSSVGELDGIRNKIEPPEPVDKDLYELPPEEFGNLKQVPGTLPEVLDALEADHEYLLEGGVFTPDLVGTWVEWKRQNEVDPIRLRPTPHEFALYYDV